MKEIIQYAREVMAKYPHLKEQIVDLHQLMKDEIADGASRDNELQLFWSSVKDLEKEQANITESSKAPQMRTERSFQLTDEGKNLLAYMEDGATDFIKQLAAFPDFDINYPFTDTYFYEIGDNSDLDMLLHSGYIEVIGGEEDLDEATWQKAYQDNFVVNQAPEETQAKLSFLSKNFLRIPVFIRGDFDLDTTEDLKDLSKTELWNAYTLTKKELEKQGALTEALEKLVGKTIKLEESIGASHTRLRYTLTLLAAGDITGYDIDDKEEAKIEKQRDRDAEMCMRVLDSLDITIIKSEEYTEQQDRRTLVAYKHIEFEANDDMGNVLADKFDKVIKYSHSILQSENQSTGEEKEYDSYLKGEEIDEAIKVSLDTLGKKPNEIMKAAQKADITITENKKIQ